MKRKPCPNCGLKECKGCTKRTDLLMTTKSEQIMKDYEFNFKKGQAEYWSKISLERQLTPNEFKRFKQLCEELSANE